MQQDLHDIVGSAGFGHLRGSHFRILSMIPPQGARPSALADIAQITRPALGELVAHLRTHGYVSTTANKGIEELRRQWSADVGSDRLDAMLDVLADLTIPAQPAAEVDAAAP